jgi:hypothetical protein
VVAVASEVRSVTVRFEAQVAKYIADVTAAGAATEQSFSRLQGNVASTNRELDSGRASLRNYGSEARSASTAVGGLDSNTASLSRNASTAGPQIDRLSGRLRILADVIAIIGPGLLPIAAVGIPALTGVAAAAGAAAIAGGSLLVAFQGVGGALKAVEEFRLDPTAANLERAQEALALIGPDATAFVARFQELRPVLRDIRDSAAAGWFPGLVESLDSFEEMAPRVERLFERVGAAGGEAVASSADSLAGPRWHEFLRFLTNEAPEAIEDLTQIVGDLGHGAAEMWMSFDPSNDKFLDWVGDVADGFDDWASSEQGRDDIAGFLEYVNTAGPQVLDFFTATVSMLSNVAQAAAPLGGPVLAGLTGIANIIGAIAGSDLGTPILAGIAALSAYNRVLAITTKLQAQAGTGGAGGLLGGFTKDRVTSTRSALQGLRSDLAVLGPGYGVAAKWSERFGVASRSLSTNLGTVAKQAGRVGLPVAGLALATSGLGDKMGLTNTASLALMGSIGGPWGAAIGGAVGFALDLASAGGKVTESIDEWNSALDEQSTSLGGTQSVLASAREEYESFKADMGDTTFWEQFDPGTIANGIEGIFGKSNVEEEAEALEKLRDRAEANLQAFTRLGEVMGADLTGNVAEDYQQLELSLQRAKPAMDDLGISVERLQALQLRANTAGGLEGITAGFQLDGELEAIAGRSRELAQEADSVKGRMNSLAEAFAGLSDPTLTAAKSADALRTALDALLDPALNAEAATHAWRASLAALRSELNSDFGFGEFTEQGRANAEMTRQYVEDSKERLTTMAAEGASEKEMAAAVRQTRQEFIESGIAAGFSRKEITDRANALGLTPKLIRTVFEAAGLDLVTLRAKEALRAFNSLPKNVRTDVKENGIPQTMAKVDALVKKYDLTEKERKALITLMDHASPGIRGIINLIGQVRDKSVTITTYTRTHDLGRTSGFGPTRADDGAGADGTTVHGPRHPYGDKMLYAVAPGEEIISNRRGQADKNRGALKAANAGAKLAVVGWAADGTTVPGATYSRTRSSDGDQLFGATMHAISGLTTLGDVARDEAKSRAETAKEEVEAAKAKIESIKAEAEAIDEAVQSRLRSSIFGNETEAPEQLGQTRNADGTLTNAALNAQLMQEMRANMPGNSPADILSADIAEGELIEQLLRRLAAMGLDGAAFGEAASNATVDELQALVSGGRGQLNRYERLYNRRDEVLNRVGGYAGDMTVRVDMREAVKELRDSRDVLDAIRQQTHRQADAAEDAPREFAHAVSNALSGSVDRANNRRNRGG